jgi:Flp pilus assembly pilin Flp
MAAPGQERAEKMKNLLKKFLRDERGLETVEYAIIAGLIVVGTIGLIASIGGWVNTRFTRLDTDLKANP